MISCNISITISNISSCYISYKIVDIIPFDDICSSYFFNPISIQEFCGPVAIFKISILRPIQNFITVFLWPEYSMNFFGDKNELFRKSIVLSRSKSFPVRHNKYNKYLLLESEMGAPPKQFFSSTNKNLLNFESPNLTGIKE